MDEMTDDLLLQELNKRFLDTKKALHDMRVMNAKIEKLNVKLAESERLKSNFLSNIRNEINNPLTAILGMARELTEPGDEQRKQLMARMVYQEAFELDFQLRNIFMAAELEAGDARLSPSRVDIAGLVRQTIGAFTHKANEKELSVGLSCGDGPDAGTLLFTTDPEKLHLIVANLLANAIEYNRAGGKVRIAVRKDQGALEISVADEGRGIPEQERERLFERFRQLDQGTSKKHKGHGLGLSITKALIELLGGKVAVQDADGSGTVIAIRLPEAAGGAADVFSGNGNEFLFEGGSQF